MKKFKEWSPLIAVLSVACALRLIFFTGMVRGDALNYAHAAYYLSRGVFELDAWVGMSRLGMYVPVAILYRLFGPNEIVTLLYPMLFSLASIVFIYLIAKMFAGEGAGLIATLFWALLPLDVHLSTSLLPDGPMAALCTGSVYFWFKADSEKRKVFYFVSLSLLAWAILIKPLAIVVAFFFGVMLIFRDWRRVREGAIGKYWSKEELEKIRLVGAAVLIAVAFLFLLIQIRPFLVTLSRSGNDLGSFLFTGEAQLDFGDIDFSRSDLMIFVAPLFLVSVLMMLHQRGKDTTAVLMWGAVLFLYYEWGSISPNPLTYTPLQAYSEARYLLFVIAPLVILTGTYLAKGLTDRQTRWSVPVIALFTLALAIVEKETLYSGGWTSWTAASTFLLVTGSIASPVFLADKNLKIRAVFTILLLFVLSLSLLQPFLPYHALMYQDRLHQLNAFRMSMPFWNEHKDYPICSAEAMSLNYASNFQLGFDWQGLNLPGSSPRIIGSLPEGGSCYLVTTQGQSAVPENWWLMTDFASGQQTVNVYRVLNELDAERELSNAMENLARERTTENLERLYGASLNAGRWTEVFHAWIELHQMEPAEYPLDHLEHVVTAYLKVEKPSLGKNLFRNSDFSQRLTSWDSTDPERITLRTDGYIAIRVGGDMVGLSQAVTLEPSTIYMFTMKIATDAGMDVDLLVIDQGEVTDSSFQPISSDNPTDVLAVFVTPDWDSSRQVRVELFAPLEAGQVRLREPAIYEIAGLAQ